jgi:tetratricopeptide (TPR) repeat protein
MFQTADSNNSIGHEIKSFGDVAGITIVPAAREVALQPMPPAEVEPTFRALVVVARPLDVAELPDIADQFELVRGLSEVEAPARLDILRPPTIEALRTALQRPPDLFHFDGHGVFGRPCPNEECGALVPEEGLDSNPPTCPLCEADLSAVAPCGYLAFEQQDGTVEMLPAEELAAMLVDSPTRLVVLSACQSAMGEEAGLAGVLLAAGVSCVLAMRESVSVATTLTLLRPFYAALGAGKTARQAFDAALPALRRLPPSPLTDTPAAEIPVLMGNDQVCLVEPGTPPGTVRLRPEPLFGVPGPGESGFYGVYQDGREPRGRKGLLVRLARALLRGEKLVWLAGVGGIGKTVLAAVAARRLNWLFPGGVVWASAADVETFCLENLLDAFAPVFLPQMGMTFYQLPTEARQQLVLQHLRDLRTPTLVALDNAEVVEDPRVFRFLRTLPGRSAALVTGREAPEWGGCVVDVQAMEPDEGVRFLVREMQRARQDPTWGFVELWGRVYWRIGEQDRERLREVAERLDGHPLALLVAAGLMRTETLEGVLKAVRQNPARGEVGLRFDFSYNRLTESQQALLHRLAAFGSDVAPRFIELACAEPYFVGEDTLLDWQDDLHELCRRCFVETVALVGVDEEGRRHELRRYRLHPVMRQYAALKAGDQAMRVCGEWMAHLFLAYVQQFQKDFNALEAEHANLLAAMDRAYELEVWEVVTGLAKALVGFRSEGYLLVRGYWAEARRRLSQATEAAGRLGARFDEVAFVGNAAVVAQRQGDYEAAREGYERVKTIFEEMGHRDQVAVALHQLGVLAQATGDYDQARHLYQQSLDIKQQLGDKARVAITLAQLGSVAYDQGDYDEAMKQWQAAQAVFHELGDRKNEAGILHQLGMLTQDTGDYDQARQLYQQSLDIAQQLGDKDGIARSLAQLGQVAELEKDYVTAVRHWAQALEIFEALGAPEREIVRGWFVRLREELGEDRFNEVLEEAAKGPG